MINIMKWHFIYLEYFPLLYKSEKANAIWMNHFVGHPPAWTRVKRETQTIAALKSLLINSSFM